MATDGAYSGKHFRMGFMTLPAPQDRLPPVGQGFAVRSQSLHSVGGGDEDASQGRKQPPPKPKRDPNTKLSSSSETVDGGSAVSKRQETKDAQETAEGDTPPPPTHPQSHSKFQIKADWLMFVSAAQCPLNPEDFRKMPPPKPKRNPNTQLSTSFDESYIRSHGNKKSSLLWDKASSRSQSPASRDGDEDEPVYIEMVGNILRELGGRAEDEQSEAVYEEMKCPLLDDFLQEPQSVVDADGWAPRCDIPAPFPNLLSQRPPLLVFPSAPAQCSPNSDESPLTPLDVTRLPVMDNVSYSKPGGGGAGGGGAGGEHRRDGEQDQDVLSSHTITSCGRSSAPPLPSNFYKSSGGSHGGHGYPRSQSACPSPVSMGRPLTPLGLKRPPPYDVLVAGGSIPRSSSSSSSSSHRAGEGGAKLSNSSSTHGSMQNVSVRSQTPTSPSEELSHLLGSGRQLMKKGASRKGASEGSATPPPVTCDPERAGRRLT